MDEKQGRGRGRGRGRSVCVELLRDRRTEVQYKESIPPPIRRAQVIHFTAADDSSGKKSKEGQVLKHADLENIGLKLEYKSAVEPGFPKRPGYGTLGRKIRLCANWFPISIPSGYVYHYDVEIVRKRIGEDYSEQPACDAKKFRCMSTKRNREVMCTMFAACDEFKGCYPAYDGQKNMYTRYPLNDTPFSKEVIMDNNENFKRGKTEDSFRRRLYDTYIVFVKPVHKKDLAGSLYPLRKRPVTTVSHEKSCAINLDSIHAFFDGKTNDVPQDALMAVETVLRNTPCLKLTPIGRSFFYPPSSDNRCLIGGMQEIWFGYHQSLRLGQWPAVNIDISATTFYERAPVLEYVCTILGMDKSDLYKKPHFLDNEIARLSKELKNLKIRTTYFPGNQRKHKIIRVTRQPANKLKFSYAANGKQEDVTVADYFQRQYKVKLMFPYFPCLQTSPERKGVYLPIEVCEIVEGQPCRKTASDEQKREMIKFTSIVPKERFMKIRDIVSNADFTNDVYCHAFDISVDSSPMELTGRVLEAPGVCYSNREIVIPKEGQWDIRDKQFVRATSIDRWILISFCDHCDMSDLKNFASALCSAAKCLGMDVAEPEEIKSIRGCQYRIEKILTFAKNTFGNCLMVIVLPRQNKSAYSEIKQVAETLLGVTTQCVKSSNAKRSNPSVLRNLCQKINAKLGGVNSSLNPVQKPAIFSKPVIIIAADVNHSGPTDKVKPSIAAAVGSLDSHPSRYFVTCRAQTNIDENKQAVEIILDLKAMVMDVLRAFYNNTKGKKPEKIIFYRDGVSEGQFSQVKEHEVRAIRDACRALNPDYQPGITFIVVQKGHHTRFIPSDIRDGMGKTRNVPPGTIVDTTVVHPAHFDFFLCSHFGLQGTSRPAHYTVLEDDNEFKADELQKLTYYLCYTYVRCTKSISVPAPVMYAHLAAFRARQHMMSQVDSSSDGSDADGQSTVLTQNILSSIKVTDALKSTMYFV